MGKGGREDGKGWGVSIGKAGGEGVWEKVGERMGKGGEGVWERPVGRAYRKRWERGWERMGREYGKGR